MLIQQIQEDYMVEKQYNILVVDDDTRIRQLLCKYLKQYNFDVSKAINGKDALQKLDNQKFDAIILDVMMPELDGLNLTKLCREKNNTPILMLTALSETNDRIKGLQAGADDYLAKPFDPEELLLRINAILRRQTQNETVEAKLVSFGPFVLNPKARTLSKNGKIVTITRKEIALLQLFLKRKNQIVTRDELSAIDGMVNTRTIDVQITRLRKKMAEDPINPVWLKTIRGTGYCLCIK